MMQGTAVSAQDEPSLPKLDQQDDAGPRSPWGRHPATGSSTSSSSASRRSNKVCQLPRVCPPWRVIAPRS